MWKLKEPLTYYVHGTLPVPTIEEYDNQGPTGKQFMLLPCNPAKQAAHPNFIGYLFYRERLGTYSHKLALINQQGRVILKGDTQGINTEDLHVVKTLFSTAIEAGHIFP